MKRTPDQRIVIIGGGTAGITVAARFHRAGQTDITLIEPSDVHAYQPLWTLVGGGRAKGKITVKAMAKVIPAGVQWVRDRATRIDPEEQVVHLGSEGSVGYDTLVVAPGIQLDWDRLPGLRESMERGPVSSNYTLETAERTWEHLRDVKGGTAVFTMPSGPMKCAGAPQKIAYLAADHWRRADMADEVDVVMVLPGEKLFGIESFNAELERIVDRYGITVRLQSEVTEIDPDQREVVITDRSTDTKTRLGYDFVHAVPPQSAPDWIKSSPLADPGDPYGFIDVDKHTMQHLRWPNVFALGDVAGSPNAKTGAAVRKQAPVVVANALSQLAGQPLDASYDGYASCPIVTAHNRMLLCEFDYTGTHHKTVPIIDTTHERYDMWLLKRYGLPAIYWHLMLKGRA